MQIHFAIFGEQNNGHGLLADSGNAVFAAQLTVLTDRPGNPPSGYDWGPIYSGFPFGSHYVFLKVQSDPTKRAGMVRSFAAYVPISDVGKIGNLSLIFDQLPADLGPVPATLAPLEIPDADLAKSPEIEFAGGRVSIARLLTANDAKLPLLWASPESYLPTFANLWAQLPSGLRESFSFYFLFMPEHHTPTTPTLIATLPEYAARWIGAQVIKPASANAENLTPAQAWLAGAGDGQRFENILRAFDIVLPEFAQLSVVLAFADMFGRLDELTFTDARKAVYAVARYSRRNARSATGRGLLFDKFCTLVLTTPIPDLLKLRNLEDQLVPELVADLQTAMTDALNAQLSGGVLTTEDIEVLQAAVDEPGHWWSAPFMVWINGIGEDFEGMGAARLISVAAAAPVLVAAANGVAVTKANETRVLEILPKKLVSQAAGNLVAFAAERSWVRFHAACLVRSQSPAEAISQHLAVAANSESLEILLSALGFKAMGNAACKSGDPALVAFVGFEVARDLSSNMPLLPVTCLHRNQLLVSVVACGRGRVPVLLRQAVVKVLDDPLSVDASFAELCVTAVARDASLLLELAAPADLIARLPATTGQEINRALENWLREQVQSGRSLQVSKPDELKAWLGGRSVVDWLDHSPLSTAVAMGVTCFANFPFLTDEDCRKWLITLFTRSERFPLNTADAEALSKFLGSVDFPASAVIVRETAIVYNRFDVASVHERIRYKYDMARAYTRKTAPPSKRLHQVLIVTALPLERQAIITHLSSNSYDETLMADVAVWPTQNPYYEIYHIMCGAGNLKAQGAVNQLLKKGIKPRLAFFAGVCGGVKDSEVGDVVFSTKVYYTEGGKEEDDGVMARPLMKETNETLVQLAVRIADTKWQPEDHGMARPPSATPAVIASSEQVLASVAPTARGYQQIKKTFNDTQAVDMEAYGFLKAMQDEGVKLCMVLRGVSDKIKKKGESDAQGSQPQAVRHVAAFLFPLLEACRPLLEPKKTEKKRR